MDFDKLIKLMDDFQILKSVIELHKESCKPDDFMLREYEIDFFNKKKEIRDYINENKIIGMPVMKKSKMPFKSTFKTNTIKSVTINPYSHKPAFKFKEDDSCVDIYQCEI